MSGYLAYGWGFNNFGRLGDNTIVPKSIPVAVCRNLIFTEIAEGQTHSLAIDIDGNAFSWGDNNNGQLGLDDISSRITPVAVYGNHKFIKIGGGNAFSVGIVEESVNNYKIYTWGLNNLGQLGDNTIINKSTPQPINLIGPGGLEYTPIDIAVGASHVLAIGERNGSKLTFSWGSGGSGQLGINSTQNKSTPVIVQNGENFLKISAGNFFSCAINDSNQAYSWGLNGFGQLGDNTTISKRVPVAVQGGLLFSQISAGLDTVVGLTTSNLAYAWGNGLSGKLGNNSVNNQSVPVAVCGGHIFQSVSCKRQSSAALKGNQIYTWGIGMNGQLGNNSTQSSLIPVNIFDIGVNYYKIGQGSMAQHVLALGVPVPPTPTPTPTITPTITPTPTPTNTPTPQPTPVFQLINECEPITMFELGIICETIQEPTTSNSYDGIIRAQVTGGTIPYFYYWIQGQRTPILSNLTYGSYPITVVDYYGDFTASTICRLIPPSPTPSPTATMTPTPTSTPVCQPLCLIALNSEEQYGPWEFICNGIMNGRQKWTYESDEWLLNIVWNPILTRWQVNGVDLNTPAMIGGNKVMISTSTSQVPISQWNFYGTVNSPFLFSVTQNPCPPNLPLLALVETQNTLCPGEQNCTGSIIFQVFGGVPPYVYSINNGVSYQTNDIFTNLCSGTYTTVIKDFMNTTYKQTVVINSNSLLENYVVSVNSLSETTIPTDGNQVPTAPCGGAYNGTFAGMGDTIQIQPLDLTNSYDNYNVIVMCNSGARPNRFNVYDDLGDLIGNTGWLGQANYSGPWGTTLNNSGLGEINFIFTLPRTYELRVEVGPASMTNPITDSWDVTVTCDITLPSLPGIGKIQNTEFEVVFNPPLSQGTFIALDLIIQYDIDNMGPWYNSNPNQTAGYLFEATVNKSGVDVSNDLVQTPITTQLTPRPNCSPSQISSSASTYTLSVVMGYGDTLTGTTICQISQINPVSDGSCISTIESYIEIYTTNSRLSGCSTCADIVNSNTPVEYTQSVVGTQLTPVVNVSSIMAAMQPCGGGSIDDHIAYTIYLTGPAPTDVQYSLRITIIGTAGENPVFDVFGFVPQGMTFDPNGLNACNGQSIEFNVSSINYCLVSVEGNAPQDLYCIN